VKDAAAHALPRHLGKEVLDRVEPGRRDRGKVKGPARMARQPGQHLGMFMGGIVVEYGVDHLAGGHLALVRIEEANKFEVSGGAACSGRSPSRRAR
jgi:hypothetical protein